MTTEEIFPTWEGDVDDKGLPHGEGKMIYPCEGTEEESGEEIAQGDVFEGHMEHGMKQGKGKYSWKDGTVYEGNYDQNLKSGQGTLTMPDGSHYKGNFAKDRFEGQGTYTDCHGDIYDGEWMDGKRHGQGTYYCKKDVCQYEGTWFEGDFTDGLLLFKDGSTYKGTFKDSQAEGPGEFRFASSALSQVGVYNKGVWQNIQC